MEKSETFFSFKEHNIYADAHLRECIRAHPRVLRLMQSPRPYMYLVHLAVNDITLKNDIVYFRIMLEKYKEICNYEVLRCNS